MGYIVRDVILTREEIAGLMANLLISDSPPTGHTLFSTWIEENAGSLGVEYNSELFRHFR